MQFYNFNKLIKPTRTPFRLCTLVLVTRGTYGVVVSMFDFHRSGRGSNPGRGGKISCLRLHYRTALLSSV